MSDDVHSILDEYTLDRARAERRARIIRIVRPFQEFARTEAASGIVIILAVAAALIAANTPLSGPYLDLLGYHVTSTSASSRWTRASRSGSTRP